MFIIYIYIYYFRMTKTMFEMGETCQLVIVQLFNQSHTAYTPRNGFVCVYICVCVCVCVCVGGGVGCVICQNLKDS